MFGQKNWTVLLTAGSLSLLHYRLQIRIPVEETLSSLENIAVGATL